MQRLECQNEKLETNLAAAKVDLKNARELNTSLTFELQNPSQQENCDSFELSELMVINKHLKDKNDELVMQLQSLTSIDDNINVEDIKFEGDLSHGVFNKLSLFQKPQHESLKRECKLYFAYNIPEIGCKNTGTMRNDITSINV